MNYYNTKNIARGSSARTGINFEQTFKKSDLNPSNPYNLKFRNDPPVENENNNIQINNLKGSPILRTPSQKISEFPPTNSKYSKPIPNNDFSKNSIITNTFDQRRDETKTINNAENIRGRTEKEGIYNEPSSNSFCERKNLGITKKKEEELTITNPEIIKRNSEKEGISILQRIIDENDQISFKFNESDNNNIVTLALKLKRLFDEKKSVNFNQENELRKKNEEITKLKNEIENVKIDRDQILNELNEIKRKNKDLKVESKVKTEENDKLRAKSVMLKEKLKNQENKKNAYIYEKTNIDVRAQNKSNPSKDEMLLYDLVPKSFFHLFEKYKDYMLIEKKRGESEKISEMFAFNDYFEENDKNLKFNKKLLEKAKSKISHFRILANDKNSFYRAIGFAYLEQLFSESLNVKKEKQFKNLRIYQLIIQLEEGYTFSLLNDAKYRKQNILDDTEKLKNIFIGGLLYLLKTKILMEEKNKNQDEISSVITHIINANSELDIAINVFIRSVISKNSKNPGKEKIFYNEEPNEVMITRAVEKFDLHLLIFNSVDGVFAKNNNEETPESDPLSVQLFYFPDHYDLAYKLQDGERSNKFNEK